jgi:hypothetical protein
MKFGGFGQGVYLAKSALPWLLTFLENLYNKSKGL